LPNHPNPFNAETTMRFALEEDAQVRLVVYNGPGQAVRSLVEGPRPTGVHTVVWDGRDDDSRDMASGIYFGRLEVDGRCAAARQMALVR